MIALVQTLYTAEVIAKEWPQTATSAAPTAVATSKLSAPHALGRLPPHPWQRQARRQSGADLAAGNPPAYSAAMQYKAMQPKLKTGDITIRRQVSIGPPG